jgi:hypothetical protein
MKEEMHCKFQSKIGHEPCTNNSLKKSVLVESVVLYFVFKIIVICLEFRKGQIHISIMTDRFIKD